jgi:tRNA-binding protein
MNIFYNKEGIGDTLIVQLKDEKIEHPEVTVHQDVVRIANPMTKETLGYNIANASEHFSLKAEGLVNTDEKLVNDLNQLLRENDFEETLTFDDRPFFIIGLIEEMEKHPNADKLNICQVNTGDETTQIVCGAPNVDKGQKVVVARVGAMMPSGMLIKDAELRGVPSSGMICSAKELDLPDAPK